MKNIENIENIENIQIDINQRKDCLDIIKTTLPSDINKIIINYIEEGNNIYNKNNIIHPNTCKYNDWEILYDNWNYSIYFTDFHKITKYSP